MFTVEKSALRVFFIFFLWLAGCGLPAGTNVAPTFAGINTPTLPLSTLGIDSKNPQIAADGSNHVFVVWQDSNTINFVLSSNGGASFTAPIPVPGSTGGTYPRLTTDGSGKAYVIWYNNSQILLNYATSSVFQNSIPISTTIVQGSQNGVTSPADMTYEPGSQRLFVTWTQCTNCNQIINDIFYSAIPVANLPAVTTPINVSNMTSNFFLGYPKITSFGGVPYIVYQTIFPTSGLYLSTIGMTTNVTGSQPTTSSASLAVDINGNSFVAWNPTNPLGTDVYINTLKAGNLQFNSIPVNLSNNNTSYGPSIGIDSSQFIYVAFFSVPGGQSNYDVFLERSSDGGKSFIGPMNISNTTGDSSSYAPGMAVVGKTAYIVWDDNTTSGTPQILFQKITLN